MYHKTQTTSICLAGLLLLGGATLLVAATPSASAAYGAYCDPMDATHVRCTAEAGSLRESACNQGTIGVGCINE